jgi:hypothetical protein
MAKKVQGFGPLHSPNNKSIMAKAIQTGLDKAADKAKQEYQAITPVRSGYLRSRWQVKMQSKASATVYNDALYANKVMGNRIDTQKNISQIEGNIEMQVSAAIQKAFA